MLTAKGEAASDGVDSYGYPYTYYDYFGGKCINCYDQFGFHYSALLKDIGFAVMLSFAGVLLVKLLLYRLRRTSTRKMAEK
jgi:hypothetical protein